MFVVCVRVHVVAEHLSEFVATIVSNAQATRSEPGNRRFDVLQQVDDPCRFTLYEVYADEAAYQAHQQTPHYHAFRAAAAPMMATPRSSEKFHSVFPAPWQ